MTTLAANHASADSRRRQVLGVAALAGTAAVGLTAWAVARSPILVEPASGALVRSLYVALTIAVGTYIWSRQPAGRFGRLLAFLGFLYALTSLNASGRPALYTLGMLLWGGNIVYIGYVYLSFPQGRLGTTLERRFIAASVVANGCLWAAILTFSHRLPAGGILTDCGDRCPHNALRLFETRTNVGDGLITAFNATTTVAGFGLAVLLVAKAQSPKNLRRRAVQPLAVVFIATIVQLLLFIYLAPSYPGTKGAFRVVNALVLLAVPVAVFIGQFRGTAFATRSLGRIVSQSEGRPVSPAQVQSILRDSLGDPTLDVALWSGERGRYVDVHGSSIELPEEIPGRVVTRVGRADRPRFAFIHDGGLDQPAELMEGLAATSLMLLENTQLVDELRASRARIVSAAEQERLRLERDLHDGAQQRLMMIQVKLALAREDADTRAVAAQLDEIAADAMAAVEELRVLAHGIYPTVLRERGIPDALRSFAAQMPAHVEVVDGNIGRLSPEIETALYFCSLEALQNASKHAGSDAEVTLTLSRRPDGVLLEVVDSGLGFTLRPAVTGLGLTSMRDRIGAVGGELEVTSAPGQGTTVSAFVPTQSHPQG